MAAVEDRDREEVQQADRRRDHPDQRDEAAEALAGGLAGDLRDAERPLQVLRADRAGQDVRRPFSDWVITATMRSTPKPSAVQGAGVSVAGR